MRDAATDSDYGGYGEILETLTEERDRYREALEIAAPYVDQKSERGQAAYIAVQSALGVETMRRLGLRVFS